MAFSLNHVQAAVNAKRELALGQSAMANAVERLSSGLRITKAADDAAAVGISEQIRSQVSGLGQSVRNANQVISMVQATDGSLTQVTDMLRRMKELATQARNGALSLDQKRAISDEISTLRTGINAMAEKATYNSNALLKNSLGSAVAATFFDRSQLAEGASVLNGLTVENLDVFSANAGDYSVLFSTPTAIADQKSRATTKRDGTEGIDNSQTATVTGSGTGEAVITLSGIYEAGDQIRFTVKGDNPDRTLVQTYTVTAENLTANNDGLSNIVSGNSVLAYTNIAAGMAAQYNAANAVGLAADVDSDGKFSKPDAVATAGTVRFFGKDLDNSPLTTVTVGVQTFNRQDYARTIIPTAQDLGEGNRITLTVNGKAYSYVVASDSTTETVAEGLRRQLVADYPANSVRAGSIVTLESDSGRTIADLSYQVHRPMESDVVSNVASTVSPVAFTSNASRFVTINDFDVIAGRRFTVDVGNPENYTRFSLIAGTDDTRVTIASKLATEISQHFGSGAFAVSASAGTIQFNSALGMGMSNIQLTVSETVAGAENPIVKPAQGITAAVWGVGGRLDDGYYDILFNDLGYAYTDPRAWTFLSSGVPGSASFNGSVLTTSPGNSVNVTLTGTPKPGDRIQFNIGPPEFGIGEPDSTVTQVNGQIYNSTRAVIGAGDLTGIDATYTVSYLSGTSWNVTGEPAGVTGYYTEATNTLRLDTTRSVNWATSYTYNGDAISFNSGENYSDISVTRTRSVGVTGISGSAYDLPGGSYQIYYNGSSWSLVSGGAAGAYISGNWLYSGAGYDWVQLGFAGTPKEGDRVNFNAVNAGLGANDYLTFSSSSNDFVSQTRTMSGVPLQSGSYSYLYSGGWVAQGATPAGSIVGTGSTSSVTSSSTKTLEVFRYRGVDESSPTATRNPLSGDYMTVTVSGSTQTAAYERPEGVTNTTFAVVGGLPAGDYLLEYNGATGAGAFNYTIKNAYGDAVLAATYSSGWLTLDTGDKVELNLTGTPKVGDRVYFTITPGNVITDRLVEGSNIGGLETSVSSQNRDRADRVITIQQADLAVGRSVEVAFGGREYAVRVESTDDAASVAYRLAGLIAEDYPNNTSANDSPEFPAATRVTVSGNQITLQEPAKVGIDDIAVTVRDIANPGVITVTAMANTGIVGRSQSLAVGEIAPGASKTFSFDDFGFSFALKNSRVTTVNDESFSAYVSPITTLAVGSLRQVATVQLGASAGAGEQAQIGGFKDIRITGANQNVGSDKVAFDNLSNLLDVIDDNTEASLSDSNFSQLENFVESVMDRVAAYRTGLGAQQKRLEYAINGMESVSENLLDINSRLQDVDYASEMARLVRMQIGQQAASAMLAQGNLLPEVILSMLQVQELPV